MSASISEADKREVALSFAQSAIRYAIEFIDVVDAVEDRFSDIILRDDLDLEAVAIEVHDLALSCKAVLPDV